MVEVRGCFYEAGEREVNAALQYAASFHCLVEEWKDCEELRPKPKEKWIVRRHEKGEEMKHRTEWCAEANRYRCMRPVEKEANTLKYQGRCDRTKILVEKIGKMEKASSGRS